MKRCGKCKELKSINDFYKDRSRSDGLTYFEKKDKLNYKIAV